MLKPIGTLIFTTLYEKKITNQNIMYRTLPFQNRTMQYNNILRISYEILKFDYSIPRLLLINYDL